ncbi:MAG: proline dehydrogenase [Ardenticatenia bacterium]|jgi:proline dehydrogenase|nr:MAG: proline dehydrogenase [Ardenticatenia bacterium]
MNLLRPVLIALSQSARARQLVIHYGPMRKLARRFIAGETLDEAIAVVKELNRSGIQATLDHLGENVASEQDARRATEEYQHLAQRIAHEALQSSISVKPTHVGLDFGEDFCYSQLRAIVHTAQQFGLMVEVDMEGSAYTQATLNIVHQLLDHHCNLRVALQAYLYRTEEDLKHLITRGGSVRLCKGAYDEPSTIAWRSKKQVNASYARLMLMMLSEQALQNGFYPALATHDHHLILQAEREALRRNIAKDQFEFQMLYGVRRDWQRRLAMDGYRVRVYVPYGTQWYPYFMRRLAERPANVLFITRALIGG